VTNGRSDDLIGCGHCERPIAIVVSIAAHDVNQAGAEKSEGGLASGSTECAEEAAGGNLEQATLFDHAIHGPEVVLKGEIALWVRQDGPDSKQLEFEDESIQRVRNVRRQLQQDVLSQVPEGQKLAARNLRNGRIRDSNIGAGQDSQRYSCLRDSFLRLARSAEDACYGIRRILLGLMWRGDDTPNPVGHCATRHREGFVPIRGPVVQTWQDVTVNVNEFGHGRSSGMCLDRERFVLRAH
jgi:hypothetical protein